MLWYITGKLDVAVEQKCTYIASYLAIYTPNITLVAIIARLAGRLSYITITSIIFLFDLCIATAGKSFITQRSWSNKQRPINGRNNKKYGNITYRYSIKPNATIKKN